MIYIKQGWKPDDNHPPMNGIRIGHEMMNEHAMCVKIQYAQQSFRSGRRELTMVHCIGEQPEYGSERHRKVMDAAVKTTGRTPLIIG